MEGEVVEEQLILKENHSNILIPDKPFENLREILFSNTNYLRVEEELKSIRIELEKRKQNEQIYYQEYTRIKSYWEEYYLKQKEVEQNIEKNFEEIEELKEKTKEAEKGYQLKMEAEQEDLKKWTNNEFKNIREQYKEELAALSQEIDFKNDQKIAEIKKQEESFDKKINEVEEKHKKELLALSQEVDLKNNQSIAEIKEQEKSIYKKISEVEEKYKGEMITLSQEISYKNSQNIIEIEKQKDELGKKIQEDREKTKEEELKIIEFMSNTKLKMEGDIKSYQEKIQQLMKNMQVDLQKDFSKNFKKLIKKYKIDERNKERKYNSIQNQIGKLNEIIKEHQERLYERSLMSKLATTSYNKVCQISKSISETTKKTYTYLKEVTPSSLIENIKLIVSSTMIYLEETGKGALQKASDIKENLVENVVVLYEATVVKIQSVKECVVEKTYLLLEGCKDVYLYAKNFSIREKMRECYNYLGGEYTTTKEKTTIILSTILPKIKETIVKRIN